MALDKVTYLGKKIKKLQINLVNQLWKEFWGEHLSEIQGLFWMTDNSQYMLLKSMLFEGKELLRVEPRTSGIPSITGLHS